MRTYKWVVGDIDHWVHVYASDPTEAKEIALRNFPVIRKLDYLWVDLSDEEDNGCHYHQEFLSR